MPTARIDVDFFEFLQSLDVFFFFVLCYHTKSRSSVRFGFTFREKIFFFFLLKIQFCTLNLSSMWFSKISRDFSGICKVRLLGLRQPMVNEATQVSRISYKKFLGLRVAKYLPHVKLKKKKIGILNFELYFLFGASLFVQAT